MNRSSQPQYSIHPRFGNPISNSVDNFQNRAPIRQKFTGTNFPRQNSNIVEDNPHKITFACDDSSCGKGCNNWETPRKMFAEFLGTLILIYVGCLGCDALSFGFALILSAQTVGHISGAHFNPAVSIAALIMGEIGYLTFPLYLVSQFVGSFVGYSLFYLNEHSGVCATNITILASIQEAVLIEFFATCSLALVCCSFWDKNNNNNDGTGPIKAGLLLAGLVYATAKFTGASFNSARSLPPCLYSNEWENHWVYWVGPNAGGAAGGIIYRFFLLKSD